MDACVYICYMYMYMRRAHFCGSRPAEVCGPYVGLAQLPAGAMEHGSNRPRLGIWGYEILRRLGAKE